MITGKKLAALWCRTEPRGAKRDDELHAYVRGPVYPRPILYALLALFGGDALSRLVRPAESISDGVVRQMIILNALRVTAVVLGGVAITSVLLGALQASLHLHCREERLLHLGLLALLPPRWPLRFGRYLCVGQRPREGEPHLLPGAHGSRHGGDLQLLLASSQGGGGGVRG